MVQVSTAWTDPLNDMHRSNKRKTEALWNAGKVLGSTLCRWDHPTIIVLAVSINRLCLRTLRGVRRLLYSCRLFHLYTGHFYPSSYRVFFRNEAAIGP
jgi:hypothetical protein